MKRVEIEEYANDRFITRGVIYNPTISAEVEINRDGLHIILLLGSNGSVCGKLVFTNCFARDDKKLIYGRLLLPKPLDPNGYARWLYYDD